MQINGMFTIAGQLSRVLVWRRRFCFKNRSELMSTAVSSQQLRRGARLGRFKRWPFVTVAQKQFNLEE